jgi:hypothetical protein
VEPEYESNRVHHKAALKRIFFRRPWVDIAGALVILFGLYQLAHLVCPEQRCGLPDWRKMELVTALPGIAVAYGLIMVRCHLSFWAMGLVTYSVASGCWIGDGYLLTIRASSCGSAESWVFLAVPLMWLIMYVPLVRQDYNSGRKLRRKIIC